MAGSLDTPDESESADAQEPPAFNPRTFGVPAYDDIEDEEDLINYSRAYLAVVIAHYEMDVDAGHIREWSVSHSAKRRAAAVRSIDLSKLGVFAATGVTSPDWESLREEYNDRIEQNHDSLEDIKDVEVVLTWDAFEAFDREEWLKTVRHEAIHIEQHHKHGSSGHGLFFEMRASDLHTDVNCPQFTDYKYPFACPECGSEAGGRYRESKAVKFARLSREEQETWMDEGKTAWRTRCCSEPITMAE